MLERINPSYLQDRTCSRGSLASYLSGPSRINSLLQSGTPEMAWVSSQIASTFTLIKHQVCGWFRQRPITRWSEACPRSCQCARSGKPRRQLRGGALRHTRQSPSRINSLLQSGTPEMVWMSSQIASTLTLIKHQVCGWFRQRPITCWSQACPRSCQCARSGKPRRQLRGGALRHTHQGPSRINSLLQGNGGFELYFRNK